MTRFLKSCWILYIDQIIVYNAFYSKLTFYIIKDRCQMHALKFMAKREPGPNALFALILVRPGSVRPDNYNYVGY
jgi:hypothetical protein